MRILHIDFLAWPLKMCSQETSPMKSEEPYFFSRIDIKDCRWMDKGQPFSAGNIENDGMVYNIEIFTDCSSIWKLGSQMRWYYFASQTCRVIFTVSWWNAIKGASMKLICVERWVIKANFDVLQNSAIHWHCKYFQPSQTITAMPDICEFEGNSICADRAGTSDIAIYSGRKVKFTRSVSAPFATA